MQEGKIIERLPITFFQVELDNGQIVLTHLLKKTAKYYLQLKPGDRVQVELYASDTTDTTHGKIVRVLEKFDLSIIEHMLASSSSEEKPESG